MGQKIRPDALRLGIVKDWQSKWFAKKSFKNFLQEDLAIRQTILKKASSAGIISIKIERNTANDCKVIIKSSRPGLIIGKGGAGIESLTKEVNKVVEKIQKINNSKHSNLKINIEDLKPGEIAAANLAQNIATDIEKRLPFRRLLKKTIDLATQNKEVQGIKIRVSGRLNGAEIARSESLASGKLPLQTLRANIDYAESTAFTTYGTIGIKVWLYKGEVFNNPILNKNPKEQKDLKESYKKPRVTTTNK